MQIRRAAFKDLDTVFALEQAYIECPWSRKDIAAALEDPKYAYFIVDDGVAYAGMQTVFEDAEITNIAVRADCRKRGIGGALIDVLSTEALARGATRLLLEVNEHNRNAIRLYEQKGFATLSYRKAYYKSQTAVVMAKALEDGTQCKRANGARSTI